VNLLNAAPPTRLRSSIPVGVLHLGLLFLAVSSYNFVPFVAFKPAKPSKFVIFFSSEIVATNLVTVTIAAHSALGSVGWWLAFCTLIMPNPAWLT
jgi:hypothetical protein